MYVHYLLYVTLCINVTNIIFFATLSLANRMLAMIPNSREEEYILCFYFGMIQRNQCLQAEMNPTVWHKWPIPCNIACLHMS